MSGILFLDSRFQNHPDSVILQKHQSLSTQSFKYNSVQYAIFKFNPYAFFWIWVSHVHETKIGPKANACSPWTPYFISLRWNCSHVKQKTPKFFKNCRVYQYHFWSVFKLHSHTSLCSTVGAICQQLKDQLWWITILLSLLLSIEIIKNEFFCG